MDRVMHVRPRDLHDYAPRCDNDPCVRVVLASDYEAVLRVIEELESKLNLSEAEVKMLRCFDGHDTFAEAERDAERYRWLRSKCTHHQATTILNDTAEGIDAGIDAALERKL